jgi:hypothetical protein
MKNKFVTLVAVISFINPLATYGKAVPEKTPTNATVFYMGFWSESYAPTSKYEIEKSGCLFYMNKDKFFEIMNNADIIRNNSIHDVKAEVMISDGEKYYIDFRGVSFYKGKYILINRDTFEKNLINISGRKCIHKFQ